MRMLLSPTSRMVTKSWYFLSFGALTWQICTTGVKTKAFRFIVWDKSLPSSRTLNCWLLFMTSGVSALSLLKLTTGVIGILSNEDDMTDRRMVTKTIGLDYQNKLCLCITLFCTLLCPHYTTTTRNIISRFLEDMITRQWFSDSFYQSCRI